jgi:hypothetical protein
MFDYFCKAEVLTNYPVLCLLSAKGCTGRYFFAFARTFSFSRYRLLRQFLTAGKFSASRFSALSLFNFQIM